MPTRIFYVPLMLCIEADNRHIALDEATAIAAEVAAGGEDRHLRKDVMLPALSDEPPPGGFTLPFERVLHRGIPD